jgi:hypothetical protein
MLFWIGLAVTFLSIAAGGFVTATSAHRRRRFMTRMDMTRITVREHDAKMSNWLFVIGCVLMWFGS